MTAPINGHIAWHQVTILVRPDHATAWAAAWASVCDTAGPQDRVPTYGDFLATLINIGLRTVQALPQPPVPAASTEEPA